MTLEELEKYANDIITSNPSLKSQILDELDWTKTQIQSGKNSLKECQTALLYINHILHTHQQHKP